MDLKQLTIGGAIGVVATGLPLWAFFESRVEKRVRYETQVTSMQGQLTSLEERYLEWNRSISERTRESDDVLAKKIEDLSDELDGQVWTIQQSLGTLREESAFQKGLQSTR